MRRCIVHFGPNKTGSSSIQATLFSELTDPNFAYAKLGPANHGQLIASAFALPLRKLPMHQFRARTVQDIASYDEAAIAKLRGALEKPEVENTIISGEAISTMKPGELARFRDFLSLRFDKIDVIGYCRPPKSLMQSVYQQVIRTRPNPITWPLGYRSYRSCFQKFGGIFGRENVHLYKFDPQAFPDGDVVRHFFSVLAIAPPRQFHRINDSLPNSAVKVLYAYHKYGQELGVGRGIPDLKISAAKELSALGGGKFRFASELTQPVIDANRADIAWIERRIGASLAEPVDDGAGAIRNEADMLDIDSAAIATLEEMIGSGADLPPREADPARYAAKLVERLFAVMNSDRDQLRQLRREVLRGMQ